MSVDQYTTSIDVPRAWQTLNARFFRGSLPPIEIAWSTRLTASAGQFVSRVGPRYSDPIPQRRCIKLSVPLLQGRGHEEILLTLAHEMIHQWQYDLLKRRPNHGADFQRKMLEMHADGLKITVRHNLEELVEALSPYTWRCSHCGRLYRRQRRTIRPRYHRCGRCSGPLRETSRADPEHNAQAGRRRPGSARVPVQLALQFPIE